MCLTHLTVNLQSVYFYSQTWYDARVTCGRGSVGGGAEAYARPMFTTCMNF